MGPADATEVDVPTNIGTLHLELASRGVACRLRSVGPPALGREVERDDAPACIRTGNAVMHQLARVKWPRSRGPRVAHLVSHARASPGAATWTTSTYARLVWQPGAVRST